MAYDAISLQQFKHYDRRLEHRESDTLIKRTVENFIDKPGGQRNQDQIRADLLPLVTVIVGQPADQPAIQFFGDARWKRLASGKVLLNTRWQIRPGAPVARIHANDLEHAATIDARAIAPVPAARVFVLVAMTTLVAMVGFPVALAVTGIGQRRHRAADQGQTGDCCNQ